MYITGVDSNASELDIPIQHTKEFSNGGQVGSSDSDGSRYTVSLELSNFSAWKQARCRREV